MPPRYRCCVLPVVAVALVAGVVMAGEKRVRWDELPGSIQASIRQKLPAGGTVGEISELTDPDGRRRYEAILMDAGGNETLAAFDDVATTQATLDASAPGAPAGATGPVIAPPARVAPAAIAPVPVAPVPVAAVPVAPAGASVAADATDEDDKVLTAALPGVVRATLEKEAGGAALPSKVTRDGDGAEMTYDADVVINGHAYEIEIRGDGILVSKVLTDDDDGKPAAGASPAAKAP